MRSFILSLGLVTAAFAQNVPEHPLPLPRSFYIEATQSGSSRGATSFKYAVDTHDTWRQYQSSDTSPTTWEICNDHINNKYSMYNGKCETSDSHCSTSTGKMFEFLALSTYTGVCNPSKPPAGYDDVIWSWYKYDAGTVTIAYCVAHIEVDDGEEAAGTSVVAIVTAAQGSDDQQISISTWRVNPEDVFQVPDTCPEAPAKVPVAASSGTGTSASGTTATPLTPMDLEERMNAALQKKRDEQREKAEEEARQQQQEDHDSGVEGAEKPVDPEEEARRQEMEAAQADARD